MIEEQKEYLLSEMPNDNLWWIENSWSPTCWDLSRFSDYCYPVPYAFEDFLE